MELEISVVENIAHVKLRGRLDTAGVNQIETKFMDSLVPAGRTAVVDLSELSFITSTGLRMFIEVKRALARKGAKLVLYAPQAQVSDVFRTTSLGTIIPIVGNEAEAMAEINA